MLRCKNNHLSEVRVASIRTHVNSASEYCYQNSSYTLDQLTHLVNIFVNNIILIPKIYDFDKGKKTKTQLH